MKIDKTPKSTPGAGVKRTTQTRPSGGSAKTSSASHTGAQDNVSITPMSAQIQALETSLADVSIIDAAKVEAVKQAISEGRFKVDAGVVADRLINAAKELLSRKD